jgi:branched-chain amino acid transport system permease protein
VSLISDWPKLAQLLVNGITLGSVYALIALGFTMVYGVLRLLNFAHGDVVTVGAFIGYFVLQGLGGSLEPSVPTAVLLAAMFLVAMAACGALGVVIERFAYRPLRDAPRVATLITSLGVALLIQNSVLLVVGAQYRSYESFDLAGGQLISRGVHLRDLHVSLIRCLAIAGAVVLMALLMLVVARTRLGKAMRATAYDREAASMMGIKVDRVIASTFFIGSALAGAAGVMVGLIFSNVFHFMGFFAGLKGFTAAVVGGIGSIPGAMLGGLAIGLAEALATGYLPQGATFQELWVFSLLILVLLVRPQGLLGRPELTKA